MSSEKDTPEAWSDDEVRKRVEASRVCRDMWRTAKSKDAPERHLWHYTIVRLGEEVLALRAEMAAQREALLDCVRVATADPCDSPETLATSTSQVIEAVRASIEALHASRDAVCEENERLRCAVGVKRERPPWEHETWRVEHGPEGARVTEWFLVARRGMAWQATQPHGDPGFYWGATPREAVEGWATLAGWEAPSARMDGAA